MLWIQRAIINKFPKAFGISTTMKGKFATKEMIWISRFKKWNTSTWYSEKKVNKEVKGLSSPCWPGRSGCWSRVDIVFKKKSNEEPEKRQQFLFKKTIQQNKKYLQLSDWWCFCHSVIEINRMNFLSNVILKCVVFKSLEKLRQTVSVSRFIFFQQRVVLCFGDSFLCLPPRMWSYLRNFVKYFAEYKFHSGDILISRTSCCESKRDQVIWLLADMQEVLPQQISTFYL